MPEVEPTADSTSLPGDGGDASASSSGRAHVPLGEGSVLAGRYRLERLIGKGGMGAVWEAEHTSLGHALAIKLIKPELAGNERSRGRFLREARAAAGLRSPYVVQIFDYGVEAGTPYIAMERLEGESLAERLRRTRRLSPSEVVAVMAQVARAVDKAHAAGIVHRDLKPDNVFITRDDDGERCKVLDFGVAKVLPDDTSPMADTNTGAVLGTPYYMSPEQATDASEVGPRSDLWSMAVITYECLVGERPFDGTTLPALSVKLLAEPVPVPSEHGEVPEGFDAWFSRATQRRPADRFGSASELVMELATAVRVDAPSISMTVVPPRAEPVRRPAVLGMAVVGMLAVFGGWMLLRDEEPSPREPAPAPSSPAVTDAPSVEPAPAPAVADVPVAAPEPALPESIVVHLQGPQGAQVFHGDALLGTLPDPVSLPRDDASTSLRIVADGYQDLTLEVRPNADQTIPLQMHPRRKTPTPSGRGDPPPGKSNVDDLEF